MSWLGAIILAIVFGVTEIYPVSGSGHFFLFEAFLGLDLTQADMAAYRAALYGGIAFALMLFYRRQLGRMVRDLLVSTGVLHPSGRTRGQTFPRRQRLLLTIATLPMLLALLLNRPRLSVERSSSALAFVAAFLALSGTAIFFLGRSARERKDIRKITGGDGLVMGFAQTLSVFPGLSRMGIVLSAAFLRGANYSGAVEQAGLMGIPASAAAAIYLGISAKKLGPVSVSTGQCAAGFLLTAVVGMITLRVLTDRAAYRKPTGFAYWCWGAALTALVLFLAAA